MARHVAQKHIATHAVVIDHVEVPRRTCMQSHFRLRSSRTAAAMTKDQLQPPQASFCVSMHLPQYCSLGTRLESPPSPHLYAPRAIAVTCARCRGTPSELAALLTCCTVSVARERRPPLWQGNFVETEECGSTVSESAEQIQHITELCDGAARYACCGQTRRRERERRATPPSASAAHASGRLHRSIRAAPVRVLPAVQ